MRDLIGRERAVIGVVTAVVAAALVYSMDRLMVDGILTWEMGQREYLAGRGDGRALRAFCPGISLLALACSERGGDHGALRDLFVGSQGFCPCGG